MCLSFSVDKKRKKFLRYALRSGQGGAEQVPCANINHDLLSLSPSTVEGYRCVEPKITGISKSSTVDNGKTLLLKCIAEGTPKPNIEWQSPIKVRMRFSLATG